MELNKGKKDTEENEEEDNTTQTLLEQYNASMRKQRLKTGYYRRINKHGIKSPEIVY